MAKLRGSTWQANVRLRNGQRLRPGGFATQQDAELWEAQARAADAKGLPIPPAVAVSRRPSTAPLTAGITIGSLRKMVLADLAQDGNKGGWKGSKDEDGAADRSLAVVQFFGADTPVASITTAEVERLANGLAAIGNTPATINRKLSALSKMLRWAERKNLIGRAPELPRYKETEGRIRTLDADEEARLLAAFETAGLHDDRRLVVFLLHTGARIGEALKLTHDDYDTRVRFFDTKGGGHRTVPLTSTAKAALVRLKDNGLAGPFTGVNYWTFRARFEAARKRAGLGDDVTIHVLRHTCATRLALAGWDVSRLKKWMGHSAFSTTERYIHHAAADLDAMVETLEPSANVVPLRRTA